MSKNRSGRSFEANSSGGTNVERVSACGIPSARPQFIHRRWTGKARDPSRYQWPVNLKVAEYDNQHLGASLRGGRGRTNRRPAWNPPAQRYAGLPLTRRARLALKRSGYVFSSTA